ncbi:microsomal glutathione s-transferase 1 [Holotrichia oblita]|uniref:Microsomal glutathione s-transferase 1 n=1 Tax=Holotrichia oblita TaxID=644536 RepID=A0ACB9TQM9_HOLOL|nr:microsomal glutathione s-transferase 1 [Holotrichia oblita]
MNVLSILDTENPIFRGFLFYNSALVLKMLAMSSLTALQRFKNKAFANPEDAAMQGVKVRTDDNVERVRRAHLNDLENIPIYFVASFGYMLTNPSVTVALNLFRAFTAARFMHTFVYAVCVIPQPARGLSWGIGYFITGFMAFQTACHFLH